MDLPFLIIYVIPLHLLVAGAVWTEWMKPYIANKKKKKTQK